MKDIFSTGYAPIKEEAKRQEQFSGGILTRFFLTDDGDEADILFLNENPVNCYIHNVKSTKNGKEYYSDVVCSGDDCPLCAEGDNPSLKSTFLIVDMRPYEYKDKSTGKTKSIEKSVRIYTIGTRVASQLDRLSNKYGLSDRLYTIVRSGKGTSTTYMFEKGDEFSMTKTEIEELLPKAYKDMFKGTEESVHAIIKKYLLTLLADEPPKSSIKKVDYDDEDEELSDGEDDEEETLPKKSVKRMFKKGGAK